MEAAILELLGQYGPLGYERIAELAGDRPGEVRQGLERLRERGLVAVVPVGVLEGNVTHARSYWRLTDEGRELLRTN